MSIPPLKVNFKRLKKNIQDLSEIGRGPDRGIYRTAFSENDKKAREWLEKEIRNAELDFFQDGAANIHAVYAKNASEKSMVVIGSHIDSVPAAGTLDGSLGVLIGLECLRTFKEQNIELSHPVELISFSDEEGRFGGLFGSQSLAGKVTPESIHKAIDLNGITLMEAMEACGYNANEALSAARDPGSIKCFLEVHIEQGPVLDSKKIPLGIVTSITGLFKWKVSLLGRADHAGTTPMNMRADALAGLAEFINEIPRLLEENGAESTVMTVGKVDLFPGVPNSVPGKVDFSIDTRDTNEQVLHELAEAIRKTLSAIARRRKLMFEFQILSEITPVVCDELVLDAIERSIATLGVKSLSMPSGAAHDAQIIAQIAPVGMIFVPSRDGRSHSPAEWTDWDHMELGANAALRTLFQLAK